MNTNTNKNSNNPISIILLLLLIGGLGYVTLNFNSVMDYIENPNKEEETSTDNNDTGTNNGATTPSNSGNSNTSSTPSASNNSGNSTTPSTPSTPSTSNNLGNSNTSSTPSIPSTSNNSGNSNTSSTPSTPSTSTTPSTTTPTTSRADSICESVKNKGSIDYASFKELSSQKTNDDYYAIKAAHECANKYNLPVVVTKGEYNIYKNKTGSGDQDRIMVETSTNLGGSTIYIHDEKNVINVNRVGKDYIYEIPGKYVDSFTFTPSAELSKNGNFIIPDNIKQKALNMVKGCENVKITDSTNVSKCITGFYVYIEDLDPNRRIFKRSKENQDSPVSESFTVNLSNKIVEDIIWQYKGRNIKVIVSAIPKKQLIFQNGIFKTIVSSKDVVDYEVKRGIKISRSNTRVTGIKHSYINTSRKTVHETYYSYHNFYRFDMIANVNFYGSTVQGMWRLKPNDSTHYGSYDVHMTNVVNMKLTKIKVSETTESMKKDYKILGGSYNKNITYDTCTLNRADTHRGVYNLTITNSTIGKRGILQIGYGKLTLENVKIEGTDGIITLRHDYGYDLYLPKVEFTKGSKIVTTSNTSEFYIYDKPQKSLKNYSGGGGHSLKYPSPNNENSYIFNNAKFENANGTKVSIDKTMIFSKTSDVKDCKGNAYK